MVRLLFCKKLSLQASIIFGDVIKARPIFCVNRYKCPRRVSVVCDDETSYKFLAVRVV